jgi:uncharacterized membrane protein YphA (DoxX/SURF4 family)
MSMTNIEKRITKGLRDNHVRALRASLGIVFLWFGVMKLMQTTPVTDLLANTYSMLPTMETVLVLGVIEVIIAIGLLCGMFMRTTILMAVVHLLGTFVALLLNPGLFFEPGAFWILTMEGEFIIKNLVLMAAVLAVASHQPQAK